MGKHQAEHDRVYACCVDVQMDAAMMPCKAGIADLQRGFAPKDGIHLQRGEVREVIAVQMRQEDLFSLSLLQH